MHLKNRIKKIEKQVVLNNPVSEFCGCHDDYFHKMLDMVYHGAKFDHEKAFLPEGDYCDKCKKRVDPHRIRYCNNVKKAWGDFYTFVYYARHLEYPPNSAKHQLSDSDE